MAWLAVVLVITVIMAVGIGPVPIAPADVLRVVLKGLGCSSASGEVPVSVQAIVLEVRMPRVILASLVGAGLAISGVVLQGLLKNPLAEPYVLGISSGSALGAVLAILFGLGREALGFNAVPAGAFLLGMATALLVYNLARVGGKVTVSTLLLAGIAVGSLLQALTSLAMVVSGQELHRVVFWLMGGFVGATWSEVLNVLPYLGVGMVPAYVFSRELNLLLLGDESARHLGTEVEKVKFILLVCASLMTAAAVSVSGVIGFVGLIIPHSVRLVVGPDHRVLVPAAGLVGAIFLVLADTLARTAGGAMEIPVGVITALCGAPFFIYLLRRERRLGF